MPSPEARMAITSLSAASRLSPSRIPTSTAMGIVTRKVLGSVKRKISSTLFRVELLRTIISRILRQIPHEEDEGKKRAPDQRMGKNFAENVAGQDAHKQALSLVYCV